MKKKQILISFLVIVIAIVAVIGNLIYRDIKLQQKVDSILNQVMEEKIQPKDIDYNSLGKYGEFTKEFGELYVKFQDDKKKIEAGIEEHKNDNVLDKKYLEDPVAAKKRSKEFLDVFINLDKTLKQDLELLKQCMIKAPASSEEKQEVIKMIDESNEQLSNETKKTLELITAFSSKCNELYDFLISIKGKYVFEGNNVIFDTQKDLDKYNELINAIMATTK